MKRRFQSAGSFAVACGLLTLAAYPLWAATNGADADEIPPLRPPRPEIVPTFWEQHGGWMIALSVVLLGLMGLAIWRLTRPRPPAPVPAVIQARQALEPLRQQPENGLLLSRVSRVVRHYLADAFGLAPAERTTAEICQAMASMEQVGPELSQKLAGFLQECDRRKFAPGPVIPPLGAVDQAASLIDLAEARRAVLAAAKAAEADPGNPIGLRPEPSRNEQQL
jgi:hypothetical protein